MVKKLETKFKEIMRPSALKNALNQIPTTIKVRIGEYWVVIKGTTISKQYVCTGIWGFIWFLTLNIRHEFSVESSIQDFSLIEEESLDIEGGMQTDE